MRDTMAAWAGVVSLVSVMAVPAAAGPQGPVRAAGRPEPCLALQVQQVATGLGGAIGSIENAADGSGRLFLALLNGRILIYNGTSVLPTPFLDIDAAVLSGGERGLLGLAFHPRYRTNGYFFVYYTREPDGDIVIARYRVSGTDPNQADPLSAAILLVIEHSQFSNHNGGGLKFGPDGYLYASVGDGGSGGDPYEAGQNLTSCGPVGTPGPCLLGKMLRLDVNQNVGTPPFYGIPPDNPFQSGGPQTCGPAFPGSTCDEIWAYGLRNPWRFSFDRLTGDLYVGDAGQNTREEVTLQPAGTPGGENYGWDVLEGTFCHENVPAGSCNSFLAGGSRLPVLEYARVGGDCVVIGGYRYRGRAYPELYGTYVYADHCSGRIWGAAPTGATAKRRSAWTSGTLLLDTSFSITTFGEDESGELYLGHLGTSLQRLVVTTSCN